MRNPLLATSNRIRFFHYYGTPFGVRLDPRVYQHLAKCAAKHAEGHAPLLVNNWLHRFMDEGLELWQIRKARNGLGGPRQTRIPTTYMIADVPQIRAELRGWRVRHWEQLQLTQEELVDAIFLWYMAAGMKDRTLFKPDKLVRFDKLSGDRLPWPMEWKEAERWAYNRNDPMYAQGQPSTTVDTAAPAQPEARPQAPITPATPSKGFGSIMDALNAKLPQEV